MQNAHLRLGLLEYHRITEKTSTRIRVRVAVLRSSVPTEKREDW